MPVPVVRRRFVRGEDVLREILGPLLAGFLVCVEFEPGVGVLLAAAADQVVGAVIACFARHEHGDFAQGVFPEMRVQLAIAE